MQSFDEFIISKLTGKKVAILGFGREGQSGFALIRRLFPTEQIGIFDADGKVRENPLLMNDSWVTIHSGAGYLDQLNHFDLILRSPGIPVWNLLSDQNGGEAGKPEARKITSQTDLFLQFFHRQVIGVTGTKGKSTTASLIANILKTSGKDTLLAGNIGNPVFHIASLIREETIVVLELSSHQLEFLTRGPHIAVMLNFFQEHLDAYPSYEAYQQAKVNITRYQTEQDFLIFSADDPILSEKVRPYLPYRHCYPFSFYPASDSGMSMEDDRLVFHDGNQHQPVWNIHQDRFLKGSHNLRNIMAAATVARLLGVSNEDLEDGIATFKGLEHRLEYVGESGGIHFYNDSIATIPEACIEAIRAIPGVDTLVAGGFDRGIDYEPLGRYLAGSTVNHFILTGDAGMRIGASIMAAGIGSKSVHYISRFDEFAEIAFRVTRPGFVCLLSPAAASYDEFRNFEERGKRFRTLTVKDRS